MKFFIPYVCFACSLEILPAIFPGQTISSLKATDHKLVVTIDFCMIFTSEHSYTLTPMVMSSALSA